MDKRREVDSCEGFEAHRAKSAVLTALVLRHDAKGIREMQPIT